MANGDFFSNMMGFSNRYAVDNAKIQFDDETDYEDVDFCQGEEIKEEKSYLFDDNSVYGGSYSSDDSIFNFDEIDADDEIA